MKRDGRQCVWCSKPLSKRSATIDHALCVSAGGSNWEGNAILACRSCNHARGQTPLVEHLEASERSGLRARGDILIGAARRLRDPRARYESWLEMERARVRVGSPEWVAALGPERAAKLLKRHQQRLKRREARARRRAREREKREILMSCAGEPDELAEQLAEAVARSLSSSHE